MYPQIESSIPKLFMLLEGSMLLLITATFSRCFSVISSYKDTITKLESKKLDFKARGLQNL